MLTILSLIAASEKCGKVDGTCVASGCSEFGWCGTSVACTSGNCIPLFSENGKCSPLGLGQFSLSGASTNGRCGLNNGGVGCATGLCCSQWGFCGAGDDYCKDSHAGSVPFVAPPIVPVVPVSPNAPTLPQSLPVTNCINDKEVALTIDDGPDNVITPQVIALLTKLGIPATFFQIGVNIEAQTIGVEAIKQALIQHPELFTVASHTYSHQDSAVIQTTQGDAAVEVEAQKVTDLIIAKYGVNPRFFRAPYGSYNAADMAIWNKMGMYMILWSVDSNDWLLYNQPDPQTKVMNSINTDFADKTKGHIILCHDLYT